MSKGGKKRFFSIRTRLFLQVGAIVLVAISVILILNNFLLPEFYTRSEKKDMLSVYTLIDSYSPDEEGYESKISSLEKERSLSIDIYQHDGTPLYSGTNELFSQGGKTTISKQQTLDDGSVFEILTNEKAGKQYLVYNARLSGGQDIEIYSYKETVDSNANVAILITSATSIVALLMAVLFIYFYTGRFTKPLIRMSRITGKMSEMDFTEKCEVKGNDEISMLSQSINGMSDSLDATLRDLHAKNAKLEEDIEKEKALDRMRKEFISNVSHELKTPISIIRGYSEGAELLLDGGNTDSAKDYCNIIVREADKMNALVYELLELSTFESGAVEPNETEFDLAELIGDYLGDNEIKFSSAGISVENNTAMPMPCRADKIKIGMVFNNYVSNAVSHCDGDKLIKIYSEELEDVYRIKVFNTGSHISDGDLENIWTSFYRADKSRSRSEGRFGLGLSIVSAIQKMHSMGYGVKNAEGGVEFYFDVKKAPKISP
ncbi:MAG: HAMP domain-containing histidine kinase [Clostridia bacterium]|nr:HAMP domain-containing histidine kinase [Clostridia bacterium]